MHKNYYTNRKVVSRFNMTFLTTEEAVRDALKRTFPCHFKVLTLKNNIMECFIENLENFEFANSEFLFYCPAHHVGKFRHLHVGYTDRSSVVYFHKAGNPVGLPHPCLWLPGGSEDHRQTVVVALLLLIPLSTLFFWFGVWTCWQKFSGKSRFYHRTDSSSLDFFPYWVLANPNTRVLPVNEKDFNLSVADTVRQSFHRHRHLRSKWFLSVTATPLRPKPGRPANLFSHLRHWCPGTQTGF